jgi:hypothetical protein
MPDNSNVNNNAAVVVVGRTAPVPPGQQKSSKSIPVVLASDQSTIPVAEQNKQQSEVALSLLGIPRSEVALGIFADVNTYDVNPSEWSSFPEQFSSIGVGTGIYDKVPGVDMGWGVTHVPEESGALIEGPIDKYGILTSKRFFRYQPGRVSSATFGVKTTVLDSVPETQRNVQNPAIRKYGIFDNFDGYYWETRNDGQEDNFCAVRRTQSLIYENPLTFGTTQFDDYGRTNPQDPVAPRGSESEDNATALQNPLATPKKFGDLVILRDKLLMTHAAVYDPSLLQKETKIGVTTVTGGNTLQAPDVVIGVSTASYNINSGLMVITTEREHNFDRGRYVTLSGIAMTCYLDPNTPKIYPNRVQQYTITNINSLNQFTVNVGVSTVPTFYVSGGHVVGLSTGQHISYSNDTLNADGSVGAGITGLDNQKIYEIAEISTSGAITLKTIDGSVMPSLTNGNYTNQNIITPVPFIQPITLIDTQLKSKTKYTPTGTFKRGMFPYLYDNGQGNIEGYIDTTLGADQSEASTLKDQIDDINGYYDKWVNQNVNIDYLNVYEYRVPRSRFSGDRLDNTTKALLYSDAVADKRPGEQVQNASTNESLTDISIWDLDFTKVTMYKIEFSWYGAVGALFLAYVPVSNGEARWVRVHHLRASNQLKVSSLGNATLPITYLTYGGGSEAKYGYADADRPETVFSYGTTSEHIIKYGASYYIDGGDRGTVKLFSFSTPTPLEVFGSKRTFDVDNSGGVGIASTMFDLSNASIATDPYIIAGSGIASSYYVGSQIITNDPLDQGIEINFADPRDNQQKLYLSSPLNNISLSSIDVLVDRPVPLIGLKCKENIKSSTGINVRNRSQVYPTRFSSGSDSVLKVNFLKSPEFQTTTIVTATRPQDAPILEQDVNIGKRGKPTKVGIPTGVYAGSHTFVNGASDLANAVTVEGGTTKAITNVSYDSSTGRLTFTSNGHGLTTSSQIRIKKESLTFTCGLDNNATQHKYPRTTDPIFDNKLDFTGASAGYTGSLSGDYSLIINIIAKTTNTFTVRVTNAVVDTPSAAEYIRDTNEGTYGYFRGYLENDPSQKPISVLGFLENRGFDRTKNIENDGYYFFALNSTNDNVILTTNLPFLREENTTSVGNVVTSSTSESSLDNLSSVLINPQIRSPIPKTGTSVATLFVPASGEDYDLSSYFDYNKEYLSFPLTNKIESLFICGSSSKAYGIGSTIGEISSSITWEEQ